MGQDISTESEVFHNKYDGNPARYIRELDLSQAESIRQRLMSDPKSLSRLAKPISMNYKAIFVEYDAEIRVEILFMENEEDLTVGWLMSETLRKVTEFTKKHGLVRDFSNFVALKTKDKKYAIDYWLSNNDRHIAMLKDRMTLVPFFADDRYRLSDQKITIDYFEILKLIGVGGYSKVYMARRKDTGQFYAIKVISKAVMIKKGKESAILKERNLMTRMDHPYIVKLHFAFQTEDKLFLVLDFLPGGELFYHIRKQRLFSEKQAKVYAGEILLGLNYMHQNNVIYRDLKPENILVDMDGHLCLADFGLSKEVASSNDLNYTFCGSPEYMAPEVIAKTGYNFMIDYYALGVLVYELVVGAPPFIRTANGDLFEKILQRDVYLPGHLSSKCKNFLRSLLRKDPKTRLGAQGITEIFSHPWLKDLNFGKVILKKVPVPVKPDPYNLNFDKEFIDVRTTGCDIKALGNPDENSVSPNKSALNSRARERVANFSFYSNLEEPLDKFTDALFEDLQSSPLLDSIGFQKRSLIGLQSPVNKDRIRKLFESKGIISGSDRNSMIVPSTQSNIRKSPGRNSDQSEARGPKFNLARTSLRPELLRGESQEEEKNVSDLTPIHRVELASKGQIDFIQPSPKLSASNIPNQDHFEAARNSANRMEAHLNTQASAGDSNRERPSPLGKNASTQRSSNPNSLFSSTMSNNFARFNGSPSRRCKLSTTNDSNLVKKIVTNPSDLESPHDSPSIFEEKVKRLRPKSTDTERTFDAEDIEENDTNEASLYSKATRYVKDPRVNLRNLNGAGKSIFNRMSKESDRKELHQPLKTSNIVEPGLLLKYNPDVYPKKNNSEGESASQLESRLKLDKTLSRPDELNFSRPSAQKSNYVDSSLYKIRMHAEPSESENSPFQIPSTTPKNRDENLQSSYDMRVLDKKFS